MNQSYDHPYLNQLEAREKKWKWLLLVGGLLVALGGGVFFLWDSPKPEVVLAPWMLDDLDDNRVDSLLKASPKGFEVLMDHHGSRVTDSIRSFDEYLALIEPQLTYVTEELESPLPLWDSFEQDTVWNDTTQQTDSLSAIPQASTETTPPSLLSVPATPPTTPKPARTVPVPQKPKEEIKSTPAVPKAYPTPEKKSPVFIPAFALQITGERVMGKDLVFSLEGYHSPIQYEIDFGDGIRGRIRGKLRHRYDRPGRYKISVLARGEGNVKSTYIKYITITPQDFPDQKAATVLAENTPTQESLQTGSSTPQRAPVPANSFKEKRGVINEDSTDEAAPITPAESSETLNVPAQSPVAAPQQVITPLGFAEVMPSYPGGVKALNRFLNRALSYPEMARENEVEGKVYVQFVVETDGRLSRVKVVRGIGYGCDQEALRLIKLMPRWQPGRQNAQNVPVLFTLPVTFNLK